MFSATLDLERRRILEFAVAYHGASIAWSLNTPTEQFLAGARERAKLIPVLQSIISS